MTAPFIIPYLYKLRVIDDLKDFYYINVILFIPFFSLFYRQ